MVVFIKKILDNKLSICIPNYIIIQNFPPLSMCAAIYHNFYIKLAIFSFRILLKYTRKRINYKMFSKISPRAKYPIASANI